MGLFEKLFPIPKDREKEKQTESALRPDAYFKTLTAYKPHFTTWNGALYESDLVRAAIDVRARHVSKLKVEIVGSAQPKLQARLRLRPNPWQTWSQFLYRASTILDMEANLVIVPVFDPYMEVIGYFPVLPRKVELVQVDGEPWLRYEFKRGRYAAERYDSCALLTRFQYKSDFFGTPNNALGPTMELVHLQNQGIEEAVKNGATFRFMATMNNWTKPEDIREERRRFTELNLKAADEDDGGLLLFPKTYTDIKQIDSKPYTVSDAEQESIRTNVYNYFGVNEDILQSKAVGDSWAAFYESCTEAFALQFSESMTFACFSDREIAQGTYIMATSNRLQYMSTQEKLNVSTQLVDRGILNRDDAREIWNLPPIPDGSGQEYIIRGEYVNADAQVSTGTEGEEDNGEK